MLDAILLASTIAPDSKKRKVEKTEKQG